jgi:predicted HAD superfamily Cof-like phosphohydrolase
MIGTGMILAPKTDPAQSEIESLKRDLYARNRENADLHEALRQEQKKSAAIERGVANLRGILAPLHDGLKMIFGEIDAMGVGPAVSNMDPRKAAVWEDWKKKLGGKAADAIDALHIHGEMTHTQLKIHMKCGQQTVYDTVHRLNKAGIINKNGGKVSLKEL